MNLYRYAGDNPTNAIDPSGLIGVFFDGNQMAEKSGTVITQLFRSYKGTKSPVFRFTVLGLTTSTRAGQEFDDNVEKACQFVKKARAAHAEPVDLFGYSRGAVAALALAHKLKAAGIPVRFVGLIEPSKTWSNHPEISIPSNVRRAFIAYATAIDCIPDLFPKHYHPLPDDPTATIITGRVFSTMGHLQAGVNGLLGKVLWQAALTAGVPLGVNPYNGLPRFAELSEPEYGYTPPRPGRKNLPPDWGRGCPPGRRY